MKLDNSKSSIPFKVDSFGIYAGHIERIHFISCSCFCVESTLLTEMPIQRQRGNMILTPKHNLQSKLNTKRSKKDAKNDETMHRSHQALYGRPSYQYWYVRLNVLNRPENGFNNFISSCFSCCHRDFLFSRFPTITKKVMLMILALNLDNGGVRLLYFTFIIETHN